MRNRYLHVKILICSPSSPQLSYHSQCSSYLHSSHFFPSTWLHLTCSRTTSERSIKWLPVSSHFRNHSTKKKIKKEKYTIKVVQDSRSMFFWFRLHCLFCSSVRVFFIHFQCYLCLLSFVHCILSFFIFTFLLLASYPLLFPCFNITPFSFPFLIFFCSFSPFYPFFFSCFLSPSIIYSVFLFTYIVFMLLLFRLFFFYFSIWIALTYFLFFFGFLFFIFKLVYFLILLTFFFFVPFLCVL